MNISNCTQSPFGEIYQSLCGEFGSPIWFAQSGYGNSVCWSPRLGIFCAVGNNSVLTSPDGKTWTTQTPSETANWGGVCWNSVLNLFCAVNGDPKIMTSPNGINWTSRTPYSFCYMNSVTSSSSTGQFVAVGSALQGSSPQAYSADGITWNEAMYVFYDGSYLQTVIFAAGAGEYVSVGYSPDVYNSSTGITWGKNITPDFYLDSIDYSPSLNLFCTVSSSDNVGYYSSSGLSPWKQCTFKFNVATEGPLSIVWGSATGSSGLFAAVGLYGATTSSDGKSFSILGIRRGSV